MVKAMERNVGIASRGHLADVLCIEADGNEGVCSGSEDGMLAIWSMKEGKPRKICHVLPKEVIDQEPASSAVAAVCFASNNAHDIFAAVDRYVFCYDRRNFCRPVFMVSCNKDEVNDISVDANGEFLASADDSGAVKIIQLSNRQVHKTLRPRKHCSVCYTTVFRPKRHWEVLSGGFDCKLTRWDFSSGKPLQTWPTYSLQDIHQEEPTPLVNPPYVLSLAFTTDGCHLCSGLGDGSISVFDSCNRTINYSLRFSGHSQGVNKIRFSSSMPLVLLSAGNDSKVKCWNLDHIAGADSVTSDLALWVLDHKEKINSFAITGDRMIIAGTSSNLYTYLLHQ